MRQITADTAKEQGWNEKHAEQLAPTSHTAPGIKVHSVPVVFYASIAGEDELWQQNITAVATH